MCGISGFISEKFSAEQMRSVVQKMNGDLAHRGPDNEGLWQTGSVCLGHRRLSIIDLSPESNQPFFSGDQRYVIVYNGELYNYLELKLQLQRSEQGTTHVPYFFKTASDTEVVLAAFARWGHKCLDYFNGMYAFAIYDQVEKKVFIARDRLGIKPLYYFFGDEGFVFSSELRPILHSGVREFQLNRDVIAEYLMYQTVLAPSTIVKGVKMLMPGHYAEITSGKASITKYYSVNKIGDEADNLSYPEVCRKVYELLSSSVQRRLVADVPFGAFLSGGIDSSAIVGLMSRTSDEKVNTFNISFDEGEFSESQYAALIAKRFNTRHHEIKLTPGDFLKLLPEALSVMDHPGGDGPNTYVVSKATRQAGISMALSGIGGDELFAGYPVFKRMASLRRKAWLNAIPLLARKSLGMIIHHQKHSVAGKKIAELLTQRNIDFNSVYPLNRSLFTLRELSELVPQPQPFNHIEEIISAVPQQQEHLLSSVSISEINTYLQNILLRDVDQMGMAVALEIREPFLDYRLVEFVLAVKDDFKYPLTPKKLLVDSLGDLLPPEIVNRPKMGFTLPWQHWLKNELKDFCEYNLTSLENCGITLPGSVEILWTKFLRGDPAVNWSRIWHLVVLNKWIIDNGLE